MKRKRKYYVRALVTCDGNSRPVEFVDDDELSIVAIQQRLMTLQYPDCLESFRLAYCEDLSLPTSAVVSNVSRVVRIKG